MSITLREEKGSPLTHQEMDNNTKYLSGCLNMNSFLHIQDQKTQGTHGGTFTAGAWRTRDLNTVLTNTISGASLATNQITLPAGKYYVEASAPGFRCNGHSLSLFIGENLIIRGSNEWSSAGTYSQSISYFSAALTLDNIITLTLRHRCSTTISTLGLGYNLSFGTHEVYSDIRIWRVGEAE